MSAPRWNGMNKSKAAAQSGAALVISLILLLLVSLVGLAAMRSTSMQEKMAGAMGDKNQAFQAAEAALRAGEANVESVVAPDFSLAGWYDYGDGQTLPDWPANASDPSAIGGGVITYSGSIQWKNPPQYYIERLPAVVDEGGHNGSLSVGDGTAMEQYTLYKIVARGFGKSTNSVVVVESVYRR